MPLDDNGDNEFAKTTLKVTISRWILQ